MLLIIYGSVTPKGLCLAAGMNKLITSIICKENFKKGAEQHRVPLLLSQIVLYRLTNGSKF